MVMVAPAPIPYGSGGLPVTRAGMSWPGFGMPTPYVYDALSARRVPAVARAIQLYAGMCKQMSIDVYRGTEVIEPRPPLIESPDPRQVWPRSRFVQCHIEDYLLSGNAVSYVTARGSDGWPLAIQYLPINWVYITMVTELPGQPLYTFMGQILDPSNVIHVARGIDRMYPIRGVGVVEEFLPSLDRAAMEEEYERSALAGGAVPSVAIVTPQATLTQDVADEAKENWLNKFAGPSRDPAILPNGTQVIPLAWSPADTQLIEARKMTLTDIANIFNLDSYWLGAAVQGMTYKTAAPQYQQILRTSIEPVLADFEQVWSAAWVPRGQQIRFDRNKLLAEDLPTTAQALQLLTTSGITSPAAAWQMLQGVPLAAVDNEPAEVAPAPAVPGGPTPAPAPEPDEQGGAND